MIMYQNGEFLFSDVKIANTFWKRFKGLMFKKNMSPNEAILLKNCSCIHTCFMRFPIDVVYLDNDFRVLKTESVQPWRIGSFVKGAKHIIEIKYGKAEKFQLGYPIHLGTAERKG